MLGVGVKGGDGLTVDTCRSGVGPDLGPGQGQIGGIGDGLQHLAHETSPPCSLSPSPHTRALDRPPVPSSRSAVRVCSCGSGGIGVRFEAWSRSAPSPVTGGPLGPPGRPPTWWRWVSGHYPAFRTTTNRLTPRRASVCLSLRVIASPTRPPPIRRPGHRWTTGHPISRARRRMRGLLGTLRGLAGSPRQQCRRGPPKSPAGAPTPPWSFPKRGVIGFPVRGQVATSRRPSIGSLLVRACGFASAPSGPLVTETPWASATELQRPKLRKDSHLLADEIASRTAPRPPHGAGVVVPRVLAPLFCRHHPRRS